jgi:Phosphate-selective porin O and P
MICPALAPIGLTRAVACIAAILLTVPRPAFAQTERSAPDARSQPAPSWNGYAQLRWSGGAGRADAFRVRRAKLWLRAPAPSVPGLSTKVQAIFSGSNGGALSLQDALVEYGAGAATLRFGQFLPAFSLERSQPDALLPVSERAAVVDAVVPGTAQSARDVGLAVRLHPDSRWELNLGAFRADGADAGSRDLLLTERATLTLPLGSALLRVGESVAYRRVDEVGYSRILGAGERFTGRDLRWGAEARLAADGWSLQGEYLQARLGDDVAYGFYGLGEAEVGDRTSVTGSVERFHDLDPASPTNTLVSAGVLRYIAGDETKLLAEIRTRPGAADHATRFLMQFQLFLNQYPRKLP